MKPNIIKPQMYIKFSNEHKSTAVKTKVDVLNAVKAHKFYDKPVKGYPSDNPEWAFSLDISYDFKFLGQSMSKIWEIRTWFIGDIISKQQAISEHGYQEQEEWLKKEQYDIIRYPNGYMYLFGYNFTLDPKTYAQIYPHIKMQKESELDKFFAKYKNAPKFEIRQLISKVRK